MWRMRDVKRAKMAHTPASMMQQFVQTVTSVLENITGWYDPVLPHRTLVVCVNPATTRKTHFSV